MIWWYCFYYPSYLASGDQECHKSDRSICNKNPECGQRLSLLVVLLLYKYLANNCFAYGEYNDNLDPFIPNFYYFINQMQSFVVKFYLLTRSTNVQPLWRMENLHNRTILNKLYS